MTDAEWEALKVYADKLEKIVASLAKERERSHAALRRDRKVAIPATRGKPHISPSPAQATAGFLLVQADEPDSREGQGRR
jgi:hypothetical protein